MDDVYGLTDSSKKIASFLTVTRKCNYHWVYNFHTLHTEIEIWKSIISQTNIFIFFPASILLSNVQRILESVCVRCTNKYVPQSALRISPLFTESANQNEKVRLTLDCSGNILNEPRKFKTEAENPDSQSVILIQLTINNFLMYI